MTKTQAKKAQGYISRPTWKMCDTCKHIEFKHIEFYGFEENKRCRIGGFSVRKTSTCDLWSGKWK